MARTATPKAIGGPATVQMMPMTAEATKSPTDWMPASRPNAEPRWWSGASPATAACSPVSTAPIAMPAKTKATPRTRTDGETLVIPDRASAMPSMSPSAAAGAPRVAVRNPGRRADGISCSASESRLARPMPRTPGVNHGRGAPGSLGGAAAPAGSFGSSPSFAPHRQYPPPSGDAARQSAGPTGVLGWHRYDHRDDGSPCSVSGGEPVDIGGVQADRLEEPGMALLEMAQRHRGAEQRQRPASCVRHERHPVPRGVGG